MQNLNSSGSSSRIDGSFRDPSGFVFEREGRIFRAIDSECSSALEGLAGNGVLARLQSDRKLVGTCFVRDPVRRLLRTEHPLYENFLEHEVIRNWTFPFEWSYSMLADAGLRTLELQRDLLGVGLSLKDASAYNIQFLEGGPVFIDLGSVEKPRRPDVWFALGQFHRMFLFPLLLVEFCGWDLRSYFIANIDGRTVEQVARSLRWQTLIRPGLWWDVTLPLLMERATRQRKAAENTNWQLRTSANSKLQLSNLDRLSSKLARLAQRHRLLGHWKDYIRTRTSDETAATAKQQFVREFLEQTQARTVLDLGCNTGEFSILAASCGCDVIAADGDPDAVEVLYRRVRKDRQRITPMVLDLGNPSPAIGFLNRERPGFLERLPRPDCVFALALIHHLLVTANLSLDSIIQMLVGLTSRFAVLEYVPRDDEMFQHLLRFRVDLFQNFSLESLKRAASTRFQVVAERPIPHSKRVLLLLEKQS